jgi:hypothetical protein
MFVNTGEVRMSVAEIDELMRQQAKRDFNIKPRPAKRNSWNRSQVETLRNQLLKALSS